MFILASALAFIGGSPARRADAQQGATVLRIATLAPRGSSWMRVFDAWNNSLKQRTDNQVSLRFDAGVSQRDERAVIRRIRNGELDGAAISSIGLREIAPPVLVLQAPGVVESYEQLDRARTAVTPELTPSMEENGFSLLGWSELGQGRIFSRRPIQHPRDLRSVRPWVWTDDEALTEFLRVVGGTGVRRGVPQVLPALTNRQIDAFIASATAASVLQWHSRVTHVTRQPFNFLVAATVISKRKLDALPAGHREALLETGEQAHVALIRRVRQEDDAYYDALTSPHRLTEVDLSAHRDEWRDAARQTRERLAGRVYSRQLLDRVMRARGS